MSKKGMSPDVALKRNKEIGLKVTKLQRYRVKRKFSQSDLAEVSGVKRRTIQSYEQGTASISGARLDTLCSLSESLDCKIEDIIEDKELLKRYKKVK